ncbi:MAG: hypothetical protein NVS2B11_13260 [Acetobacteraceae bacterium]
MAPEKRRNLNLSVTLTRPQHQELAEEAHRLGLSLAELLRRVVDEWRARRRPPPKE